MSQAHIEVLRAGYEAISRRDLERAFRDVVVFVRLRARPKGSSAAIEIRNGHLWTTCGGELVSMRIFPEPEKALEAGGLQE